MKFLLTLALAGLAGADIVIPNNNNNKSGNNALFVSRYSSKKLAMMTLRGGAKAVVVEPASVLLMEPLEVAKSATKLALWGHSLQWLVPEKTLQVFGLKNPTSQHVWLAQRQWAIYVSASLMLYLRLFPKLKPDRAIGYGSLPFLADVVRSVLNDDGSWMVGVSTIGQALLSLAPLLVTVYACLFNMDAAADIVQACGIYNMLKGLWYVGGGFPGVKDRRGFKGGSDRRSYSATSSTSVASKKSNKGGFKKGSSGFTFKRKKNKGFKIGSSTIIGTRRNDSLVIEGAARWMGAALFTYGLIIFAQVEDISLLELTGYSWIPGTLLMCDDVFYRENVGLHKWLYAPWLLVGLVVVTKLAISIKPL